MVKTEILSFAKAQVNLEKTTLSERCQLEKDMWTLKKEQLEQLAGAGGGRGCTAQGSGLGKGRPQLSEFQLSSRDE